MPWRELDLNLVPHVGAQSSADALLQPTFGSLEGVISSGPTASITLTASDTNLNVGDNVDVDIEVKTGTFTINEYRIVIDFDPTKLQVIDAESNTPGTQISFLDTVFSVNSGDNTVSSAGRITLIAKTSSGNALQVNRKIAKITFQAQSTGSSVVQTVTGATGSQLINQNGVAIANSVNSITLNLGNTIPSTSKSSQTKTTSQTVNTSTTSSGSGQLPDTALSDDIGTVITLLFGLALVLLGAMLHRNRKKYDE